MALKKKRVFEIVGFGERKKEKTNQIGWSGWNSKQN